MEVLDLDRLFASLREYWQPLRIARANGQDLRLARLRGRFVWHAHPGEDEVFLVHRGRLLLHLETAEGRRTLELGPGQLAVVPRGTRHCPEAPDEALVLLFEPSSTVQTGDSGERPPAGIRDLRSLPPGDPGVD